jgi:uncharacterized protein YbjT (DUF2867 family)
MDLGKPILVTGASGKTGQRMVASIAKKGGTVRAFVRRPEAGGPLRQAGAAEIALGDLMDHDSLRLAMTGAGQVLHICPPMHPKEDAIARTMIGLACDLGVDRFVLYSVLHPLLADVPHHDRKLQGERALVDSGLNYTILQPSRYMQHLTMIWKNVLATGVHSMPFGATARFSLVDLADVAEATARVMTEPGTRPRPISSPGRTLSARKIARAFCPPCSAARSARWQSRSKIFAAMPWPPKCRPNGSRP